MVPIVSTNEVYVDYTTKSGKLQPVFELPWRSMPQTWESLPARTCRSIARAPASNQSSALGVVRIYCVLIWSLDARQLDGQTAENGNGIPQSMPEVSMYLMTHGTLRTLTPTTPASPPSAYNVLT